MPTALPQPTGRIRVVVVDADDLVRETVAALLGIGGRIEVVGIAGQSGPATDIVSDVEPDVVLVDPRLPDLADGLAFIDASTRWRRPSGSWSCARPSCSTAGRLDACPRIAASARRSDRTT